jgi:hypothetical protein
MVGLIDGDDPPIPDPPARSDRQRHRQFLCAWVELWGTVVITQSPDFQKQVTVQAVTAEESVLHERTFALRLLHAAGRDEVWLDDRRLLYLPSARNPRKVGFRLYVTGVTVDTRVTFSKLDPTQVPQ